MTRATLCVTIHNGKELALLSDGQLVVRSTYNHKTGVYDEVFSFGRADKATFAALLYALQRLEIHLVDVDVGDTSSE